MPDNTDIDEQGKTDFLFSIVMPAYNEEALVGKTLASLTEYLSRQSISFEIIAVDDSSTDKTAEEIKAIAATEPAVKYVKNTGPGGYGFAIQCGLKHYSGDAVVIVTADGADAPKDVYEYFQKINDGYDCVFGSRFVKGARVTRYPPFKLVMNRIANGLLALVLGKKYNDFTNGFKCYRRHVIDSMQPIVSGQFNITIELAAKAILGGWRFAVTPTDWRQRDAGESSFSLLKLIWPYTATLIYCMTLHYIKNIKR